MLYSFPVSPSIVFGAPCWVVSLGTAFFMRVWGEGTTWVGRLGAVSWKDENNNKLLYCGTPRKASRLLFWV